MNTRVGGVGLGSGLRGKELQHSAEVRTAAPLPSIESRQPILEASMVGELVHCVESNILGAFTR